MLEVKRRIALIAGGALAVGAVGSGVAFAAAGASTPPRPATYQTAVTGHTAGTVTGESSSDPAGSADAADGTDTGPNVQSGPQTASDTETSARESQTAAGSEADGPGGHADPGGVNVDHQFNGNE